MRTAAVIFGLPTQTRYDLKWRMFGTEVRVTPFFWVASLILGFHYFEDGFEFLLIWIAVFFVSILVHEFGHIIVGRYYGSYGHIVLHGLGGLAIGSNNLANRWQRIAVSLGGPGAQLLFLLVPCLIVVGLMQHSAPPIEMSLFGALGSKTIDYARPSLLDATLDMMIVVNLFWPLINLIPVYPLDGGQVCRELIQMRLPGTRGVRMSLIVSMITAGVCAVLMLLGGLRDFYPSIVLQLFEWTKSRLVLDAGFWLLRVVHPVNAILFGLLGVMAYLQLKALSGGGGPGWRPPERREPWQMDPDYWKTGRSPWGN